MKKAISVLLIFVMVMALAACGKKEDPQPAGNQTTEAPATKTAEPTKAAEATPEPTKEVTPEATPEPTEAPAPKPTEEPAPEPTDDPEIDEWDGPGHDYDGLYESDNGWVMCIDPEGAADIITVYDNYTDRETFGTWHEFWTNFDQNGNVFVAEGEVYHYATDEIETNYIEGEVRFEVNGSKIFWVNENMEFEKISDDTSDNKYYVGPGSYSGDVGDGFGAEFTLENVNFVDVIATTYYGVYCQSASDPMEGSFYPYYGDEMSMETMDEFNAAFLDLGVEETQGQFCFLDNGINEDVTWTLEEDEFGPVIVLTGSYTGEVYRGRFYWDNTDARLYVCIRVDEYDVWLSSDTRVVSFEMTEEQALQAIVNYINETNESLAGMLEEGQYGVAIGVGTEENESIRVWLRSYTGAYKFYYINPVSGETYVTEYAPMIEGSTETSIDESLNAWDYIS